MEKILIVEDNHMLGVLLKDILQEWKYKALLARDGRNALAILQKEKVSLVLSDVNMPGINGIELLKIVRKKYEIPVIIMSSDYNMEKEALNMGAKSFLKKPFDFKKMKTEIEDVFSKITAA